MTPIVRQARFDLGSTGKHWIPHEPYASHLSNALHMLFPVGERWFVSVFRQALPLISDDALRKDAKAFMGQEAVHARAHAQAVEYLERHGFQPASFVKELSWRFERHLGDGAAPGGQEREWLLRRLAIVAAVEHFTAVLGLWALTTEGFERAKADPAMLQLFRWHSAEEVEHRSVAFDVFQHLDGSYVRRAVAMLRAFPSFLGICLGGAALLRRQDPACSRSRFPSLDFLRAARRGLAPSPWLLLRMVLDYLRPGFHPSQGGESSLALEYLRRSTPASP